MNAPLVYPRQDTDHRDLVRLAADAFSAYPQRTVFSGSPTMVASDWLFGKRLEWARVARVGDVVVGHVGVRSNNLLADGSTVDGHDAELCQLVVDPKYRRSGVASALVDAAVDTFGTCLWTVTVPGEPSGALFERRGWLVAGEAWYPDEAVTGVVLASSEPATYGRFRSVS